MSSLSTHVLDTALGRPAAGVAVRLEIGSHDSWSSVAAAATDGDGRIADFGALEPGRYRLIFDTQGYLGPDAFFPEVAVTFRITQANEHHHVPLLLSPFAFSTYRGS
jgi:5-hydroxyisourate hydrolase